MGEIHAKKIDEKNFSNIFQEDVVIKGDIHFDKDCLMKGKVHGSIRSAGDVVVEKDSVVNGNIAASQLHVLGRVEGNIYCEKSVKISEKAFVVGDISAFNLNIEPGSFFEGRSIMINHMKDVD